MQYRHVFHAGNFADVHKHIALLQLIALLQKKEKGFLYLDTHAGEGLYDLSGPDSRQGAESGAGIGRLEEAAAQAGAAPIQHYLATVDRIRRHHGNQRSLYPGSPLLAAISLRAADSALCFELQAPVSRALQRALDRTPLAAAARVENELVLIDPPYEAGDEERQLATALQEGLQRFETGVFAIWYPIKRQHEADLWISRVTRGITRPTVTAEFCLHVADHSAGLNGSGMLVMNPPWQFAQDAAAWQPALEKLLGAAGGSRVHWVVRESR
jgi:23S rRNA (adenine2030-N6)-methyltransferase